jgi:hypothetical protein
LSTNFSPFSAHLPAVTVRLRAMGLFFQDSAFLFIFFQSCSAKLFLIPGCRQMEFNVGNGNGGRCYLLTLFGTDFTDFTVFGFLLLH